MHFAVVTPYPTPHILGMASTTIDHFPQLQELELLVDWSSWKHIAILSSMTSTEFRKITFLAFSAPGRDIILQERDVQDTVDEQPCEPVTRV